MLGLKANKEPSDEEAMLRFQKGKAEAFDLLLHRHSAPIMRFAMKMAKVHAAQAEDLMQEIFMKVIERRKQYDSNQKFTTWLYALARNHCIDYLRMERPRRHASLDASLSSEEGSNTVVLDIVRSIDRNQEENAIDKETHELLKAGIEDLKEEYREVFLLKEVEGLSLQEIADITESPLGTVKSRFRYACQILRTVFVRAGYVEERREAKEV